MRSWSSLGWRVRRRLRFWPVSVALAALAGLAAAGAVGTAASSAMPLGPLRRAPVANTELAIGHVIGAGDVEWREVPAAVASAAVGGDPVGRVVVERVLAGEVIAAERLAGSGEAGVGALVPDGARAVGVPTQGVQPPIEVGDRVDVVSAPALPGSRAVVVARSALVVAVAAEVVTVAVDERELGATAGAVLDGTALLALVGPRR